jgi:hypothetical protein
LFALARAFASALAALLGGCSHNSRMHCGHGVQHGRRSEKPCMHASGHAWHGSSDAMWVNTASATQVFVSWLHAPSAVACDLNSLTCDFAFALAFAFDFGMGSSGISSKSYLRRLATEITLGAKTKTEARGHTCSTQMGCASSSGGCKTKNNTRGQLGQFQSEGIYRRAVHRGWGPAEIDRRARAETCSNRNGMCIVERCSEGGDAPRVAARQNP